MISDLRLVASFALLGAVVMGVAVGWVDNQPIDFRLLGAVIGAAVAIAAKLRHAL